MAIQYDYGLGRAVASLGKQTADDSFRKQQAVSKNEQVNRQFDQNEVKMGESSRKNNFDMRQKLQDKMIKMTGMTADYLGALSQAPDEETFKKQAEYTRNLPVVKMMNRDGSIDELLNDKDKLMQIQPLLANISGAARGKAPLHERAMMIEKSLNEIENYQNKKLIDLEYEPQIAEEKARRTAEFKQKPQGLSVRLKDGTVISQGGYITPEGDQMQNLSRSVKTGVQKDLIGNMETQSDLKAIEENFSPDLLTYQNKLYSSINNILDKSGLPSDTENIKKRVTFENNVDQFFNAYRKEITGAAAAEKELQRLEQSILNKNMSPAQFTAALKQIKEKNNRMIRIKRLLLRRGIKVGDNGFGDTFDSAYLGQEDDNIRDRMNDLFDKYMGIHNGNEQKAADAAREHALNEGYSL